ncbi:MAG: hypothetical protein WAU53_15195, partial [Rhodoplanes sp.]
MRENAHLYIRHDAHRFMRPDAPGWSHPDEKLRNLYFRFATRKALGLPPLTEADAGWQIILKSFARYQEACRKAGFNPDQPRVPAGNPGGGGGAGRHRLCAIRAAASGTRRRRHRNRCRGGVRRDRFG